MRTGSTLNYLVSDHLGSTSLVTDSAGNVLSQQKYKAWGEERYSSGTKQTSYGFTGQDSYEPEFGLQFFNARWYDSSLGRFAQADTIVPGGVQGLDRYAYVNNNPLRYTDPTGHMCREDGKYCEGSALVKTKVGDRMITGNGIQRSNGRPPATPCLICHVSPSTATPTLTPTPTTSNCPGPYAVCVPTATSTPSPTPTAWQPFGQRTGQNIANTAVAFAPTAIDFCLGAPNGYAGPGCGQWVGQAYPPAAFGGEVFDTSVVAVHFLLARNDLITPNYPTANPLSATPSATQTQFPQTPTSSATPWLMTPTIEVPSSTPTPYWSQ